jgi:hypothetical protein
MPEAVQELNGIMWIFAILLAGTAVAQALLFARHALRFNQQTKLVSSQHIKSAIKVGAVSVIGPCFSTIVIAIATIAIMGPATTFMRCAVIGSDSYELVLIDMGATALGVTAGGPDFDEIAFTVALFAMTFGTMPYLINLFITMKPLDKIVTRSILAGTTSGKKAAKKSFLSLFGLAAAVGLFTYNSVEQTTQGIPYFLAVVCSVAVTYLTLRFAGKSSRKDLSDWVLAFSLVTSMVVGTVALNCGLQ